MNIHEAAAKLYESISAPVGAVNTLAYDMPRRRCIKVLIDPAHWALCKAVPSEFEGYRVRVEKRPKVVAH